jgi:hypothetical protein
MHRPHISRPGAPLHPREGHSQRAERRIPQKDSSCRQHGRGGSNTLRGWTRGAILPNAVRRPSHSARHARVTLCQRMQLADVLNTSSSKAAHDEAHDANIAKRESVDEAKHGGHLTKGEQKRLNGSLNKNSKRIYKQKH